MSSKPPYHLQAAIGYQLSRTARLQERGFEAELKHLGLSRTTWCILLAIENEGLHSPSDIADFIGIDRTATSRALRKMAGEDLIAREDTVTDGRRAYIKVTRKGCKLLAAATQFARKNAAHFEEKLTSSEQNVLRELLSKLQSGEGAPLAHL